MATIGRFTVYTVPKYFTGFADIYILFKQEKRFLLIPMVACSVCSRCEVSAEAPSFRTKHEEVREGLKNKKNKKYGIFHNRAGGGLPHSTLFFYLFSDSKVRIFSKI